MIHKYELVLMNKLVQFYVFNSFTREWLLDSVFLKSSSIQELCKQGLDLNTKSSLLWLENRSDCLYNRKYYEYFTVYLLEILCSPRLCVFKIFFAFEGFWVEVLYGLEAYSCTILIIWGFYFLKIFGAWLPWKFSRLFEWFWGKISLELQRFRNYFEMSLNL